MVNETKIDSNILDTVIFNESNEEVPVKSVLEGNTLLVFLRHFGCIGCAAHLVEILPSIDVFIKQNIKVVFIGNGDAKFIRDFKEKYGIDKAFVFTDPELKLYSAFGLKKSLNGAVGFGAVLNVFKLVGKGLIQTSIQGSVTQQGGVALVDKQGQIVFQHRSQKLGDNAPVSRLIKAANSLTITENI